MTINSLIIIYQR